MARILTGSTVHDEIRLKLGVTDTILPSTDIDTMILLAEAQIIRRTPDWASLVDDDKTSLIQAAECLVAASACPVMAVRLKQSEQDVSGYKFQRYNTSWSKRKAELTDESEMWLGCISTFAEVERVGLAYNGPTRNGDLL